MSPIIINNKLINISYKKLIHRYTDHSNYSSLVNKNLDLGDSKQL